MSRTEIMVGGVGGQGVVLAGILLGTAATLFENKKAVQTQSYSSELRGGSARAEVIISEQADFRSSGQKAGYFHRLGRGGPAPPYQSCEAGSAGDH